MVPGQRSLFAVAPTLLSLLFFALVGAGPLSGQVCGDLGDPVCSYDFGSETMTVTWEFNPNTVGGVTALENGVAIATAAPGASALSFTPATAGRNTYTLEWACLTAGNPGPTATCLGSVSFRVPVGTTDLIFAQEGTESSFDVGLIDGAATIATELLASGRSPHTIYADEFHELPLQLAGIERVWVALGTFPDNGRVSVGEGNFLAGLSRDQSIGLYLEGEHWGFQHVVTALDVRDGVVPGGAAMTGFTSMVAAPGGSLPGFATSFPGATPYLPDQPLEFTTSLTASLTDVEVGASDPLWINFDDSGTGEPPFFTSFFAVPIIGAPMIGQSFEFGGFTGDRALLLEEMITLLATPPLPAPLPEFVRGDANADGTRNIADATSILAYLFPTANSFTPPCTLACDVNDDEVVNIADAIGLLTYFFPGGGPPVPVPDPNTCDTDPTPGVIDCASFPPC